MRAGAARAGASTGRGEDGLCQTVATDTDAAARPMRRGAVVGGTDGVAVGRGVIVGRGVDAVVDGVDVGPVDGEEVEGVVGPAMTLPDGVGAPSEGVEDEPQPPRVASSTSIAPQRETLIPRR